MMTNTYVPHVGGVARSVETFTRSLRSRGHRVLVVAPTFDDMPEDEADVVRVPAIQRFNGSDFSVRLPIPGLLSAALDAFEPTLVHSHHPFLLGDTALRVAARWGVPLVFTHHTMYERYTHYVPGDSPVMKRFVKRLATEYANLCDQAIAPSESVADILEDRGVSTPITAIPTGVDPGQFAAGDGRAAREQFSIPSEAWVVGHVGRLAPEKNLAFLSRAVARFIAEMSAAHFLVVGDGPIDDDMMAAFAEADVRDRLHMAGKLEGRDLRDAYHAMDVFAFSSHTETQGMVLVEAMAAGVPVVAVDAPGVREVVSDGENGRLLDRDDEGAFGGALREITDAARDAYEAMRRKARETAMSFSVDRCTERLEAVYEDVAPKQRERGFSDDNPWAQTLRLLETEWNMWNARAEAAVNSFRETS